MATTAEPAFFPSEASPRTDFLYLPFDRLDLDGALNTLLAVPANQSFRYLVTPNVDHMVRITEDPEVARLYREAWLCINDSRVLALLAKTCGTDLPPVPGSDLVAALLTHPKLTADSRILIVGGGDGLAESVADLCGLTRVEQIRPPMGLRTDPAKLAATVEAIEARPARFVVLAVGSPQQELLANALARRGIAKGVGLCIGAGLEFLVGDRARAPAILRTLNLEWLFRLACEPRRLGRRYLIDGPQIFRRVWEYRRRAR